MAEIIGRTKSGHILSVRNEDGDGRLVYYLDNIEIGGYSPKVTSEKIIFREGIFRQTENLDEYNNKLLPEEVKAEIEKMLENVDIKQLQQNPKDYAKEEIHEMEKVIKPNSKIRRVALLKDINIEQELPAQQMATTMKTVGQLFATSGKMPKTEKGDFVKSIGVIEADELGKFTDEAGNKLSRGTTRYSLVAITNNGKVMPIPLQQDSLEGNDPREVTNTVMQNEQVRANTVLSRFILNGNSTISIDNGKYGEIEVYYSQDKTRGVEGAEGNKNQDIQLPTTNVWEADIDEREKLAPDWNTSQGIYRADNAEQEINSHIIKEGESPEELKPEDFDGDKDTYSHNHISNDEKLEENTENESDRPGDNIIVDDKYLSKLARELLDQNENIADIFNMEDVKNEINKVIEQNAGKSKEEILQIATAELSLQADREHGAPERYGRE